MKIITITLSGPVRQGWLILNHVAPTGGGCTGIGVMIKGDTWGQLPDWETVAKMLVNNMGRPEWPSFLKANVSKNRVRVTIPDGMDATYFSVDFDPDIFQGAGPEPRREPIIHNPEFALIEDEMF